MLLSIGVIQSQENARVTLVIRGIPTSFSAGVIIEKHTRNRIVLIAAPCKNFALLFGIGERRPNLTRVIPFGSTTSRLLTRTLSIIPLSASLGEDARAVFATPVIDIAVPTATAQIAINVTTRVRRSSFLILFSRSAIFSDMTLLSWSLDTGRTRKPDILIDTCLV
ncbi:hypothetical protein [Novosphingopyxis sp.]|uniref:hypothetical protein n=1 Tax=Novosphingopyxis sp. TaxID=2709690 RepID=UPI003B59D42F